MDTGKRVNYTLGMLLGVDDFVQEQAWHIARRHELARELLGYGTVRGLQVLLEPLTSPPSATRVRITPGMAWTPSGTAVCVPSEQCCDVDAWLANHGSEVTPLVSGSPATVTLYVVLSYAACLTDNVPIPGEPCRSEDELMQPSRVADSFLLELRTDPPPQTEEDAIRDFADWLAAVPVDSSSPPASEADFMADLRDAAMAWLQPSSPGAPRPGDYLFGSPPAGLASTDALLRAALRLWVTELRPLWRARYGCAAPAGGAPAAADAVLLAELQVPLLPRPGGGWATTGPVTADETRRPVQLSLRMVQELVTQNAAPEPGDSVVPALAFGQPASAGSSSAYARADHSHGTPALPPLAGDVAGPLTNNRLVRLLGRGFAATAPRANDVLVVNTQGNWGPRQLPAAGGAPSAAQRFGLAVAAGTNTGFARADHNHGTPTLSGDATAVASGRTQQVRVEGLRGHPIDAATPTPGQVLTFGRLSGGGSGWLPAAPAVQALVPATAVRPETLFGQAQDTGTSSTEFARADHSHGTPTLAGDATVVVEAGQQRVRIEGLHRFPIDSVAPQAGQVLTFGPLSGGGNGWRPVAPAGGAAPGTAVVALQQFGLPVALGSATTFARADHSHGTPALSGDVQSVGTGTAASARVVALQGVGVRAQAPQRDQVLAFDGSAWLPATLPAQAAGNFVGRSAGPYALVAAGHARVVISLRAAPGTAMLTSYNRLVGRPPVSAGRDVRVEFQAPVADADNGKAGYIVKLTPVWRDDFKVDFSLYLLERVVPEGTGQIQFTVLARLSDNVSDLAIEFQIEVSRFES
ncbi:MAG: hypothetical protein C0505_04025 [Leptothrix sp. (in: Bacteria)]|nr:hypothetical protein [Leptothrix sp. (in: b-proteobacteria)]